MPSQAQRAMQTLENYLQQVGTIKSAEEAHTEAGSIGGETEHPVKDVTDRTQTAETGFRAAENEKDVKEDQGPPSVESHPEATPKAASFTAVLNRFSKAAGSMCAECGKMPCTCKKAADGAVNPPGTASEDQLQIGTNKKPTGEDPKNETASAKGGKEDGSIGGPSSHPARTDNDALEGGKYAYDANTPLEQIIPMLKRAGDNLFAQVSFFQQNGTTSPTAPATTKSAGELSPELAAQAGWELAGLMTGTFDKQAADAMVHGAIVGIIKEAVDIGDRTADFLDAFMPAIKQADGENDPADPSQSGGDGGTGMPPGGDEAAMMGTLGGGMPAGGPPGQSGGDDTVPPGADGGGDDSSQTELLLQVLAQLGVTPDQIPQILAGAGGAPGGAPPGAGGPPPGAGGPPPPGAGGPPPGMGGPPPGPPGMPPGGPGGPGGAPPPGMEVQGFDKAAQATKTANIAAMRSMIQEIVSRSKPRR